MSKPSSAAEFEGPLSGHQSAAAAAVIPPTDGERLMWFHGHRDEGAFAELIEMHAPMVWGVCSQVLRHHQDVEDAFQATFLILARKGRSIRGDDSVAGWLYSVAFRTALLARDQRVRRNETPLLDEPRTPDDQLAAVQRNDQCLALLEELNALPARYRQPLVLCHLEGRSRRETANEMGVTLQAVKGLLARGTRLLRSRLVRRGTALSTSMAAVNAALGASHAAVEPTLVAATAALGSSFALKLKLSGSGIKGASLNGGAPYAYALAEKGILAMTVAAASKPAVGLLGICLTVGLLAVAAAEPAKEQAVGGAPAGLVIAGAPSNAEAEQIATIDVAVEPASDEPRAIGVFIPKPSETNGQLVVGNSAGGAPTDIKLKVLRDEERGDLTVGNPGTAVFVPAIGGEWTPANIAPQKVGITTTSRNASSKETLALELEYWHLKARGLQQKADAMAMKAESLRSSGHASPFEAMELEAESQLTLAEVKLCEMNAQRIKLLQAAAEAGMLEAEALLSRPPANVELAVKAYRQAAENAARNADDQAAVERLAAVFSPHAAAAPYIPTDPTDEAVRRRSTQEQLLKELKKINGDLQRRIEELELRLEKSDPRTGVAD